MRLNLDVSKLKLCAGLVALGSLAGASTAHAELVYGTTLTGQLVSWDSATPGTLINGVAIQGLASNEQIAGIDVRPSTGELYAMGSFSHIYTINPATGIATPVGSGFSPALNGSTFGFDFNPTVDRIRETSNAAQNQRLNPITGGLAATDTGLSYATGDVNVGTSPDVSNVAYSNNFAGATTTTLYGIDSDRDTLVTISPPNNGTLNTIGSLGFDSTVWGGFDISGVTGMAYFADRDANLSISRFYSINLATGAAINLGQIDGGIVITAMTVASVPEPLSGATVAAAFSLLAMRRHRV